jgi:hypothetical protein
MTSSANAREDTASIKKTRHNFPILFPLVERRQKITLKPMGTISGKPEKKLSFMATMGQMPIMLWNDCGRAPYEPFHYIFA